MSAHPRWYGLVSASAATACVAALAFGGTAAFTGRSRYAVKPGDTLDGLSVRFGVTVTALVSANGIKDPNRILAGQYLVIPSSGSRSAPATSDPPTPSDAAPSPSGPLAPVRWPQSGSPRFPSRLLAHPQRLALLPVFRRWAPDYGVPTGLLEAMAWMESGWQTQVVSSTGAVGVGQIEPATAVFISHQLLGLSTTLDRRNASANIRMSAAYLGWLLRQTGGNIADALGAYYQGLLPLRSHGPYASTREYVADIGTLWQTFRSG